MLSLSFILCIAPSATSSCLAGLQDKEPCSFSIPTAAHGAWHMVGAQRRSAEEMLQGSCWVAAPCWALSAEREEGSPHPQAAHGAGQGKQAQGRLAGGLGRAERE